MDLAKDDAFIMHFYSIDLVACWHRSHDSLPVSVQPVIVFVAAAGEGDKLNMLNYNSGRDAYVEFFKGSLPYEPPEDTATKKDIPGTVGVLYVIELQLFSKQSGIRFIFRIYLEVAW